MTDAAPAPVRELPAVRREDRGKPVVGRMFDYAADPVALMQDLWDAHGPVAPMRVLGGTAVMLLGPAACETALRNADRAFVSGPAWSRMVGPFFHRGLMLLDGDEHHAHRRIMQQAFTRTRLEGYVEAMHAPIARGLDTWEPRTGFRAYPALKELTLDVAAEIFMGGAAATDHAEMQRVNRAFIACVQAAGGVVRGKVPFTRWGRAYAGRRVLEDFLRSYLPAKRAEAGDDLFSVLCHIEDDEGERFSDQAVIDHMVFLMMAAHDTSTSTLSALMQLLGQHPEWRERCRTEALAMPEHPGLADLDGATDLDLVMREALRLRPPVPVVVRQVVRDTVVEGVRLPAGTEVVVGLQHSHLMPELWSDPTAFDPDRFAPDRREDRSHRMAWEPFGGGVHKCLGLFFAGAEVKATLHQLLRRFDFAVDPAYVAPLNNHSLPFPTDGQPVDLRPRVAQAS